MSYALLVTRDEILAAQFQKMCAVTQSELVVVAEITTESLSGAYRVFVDQSLAPQMFNHEQVVVLATDGITTSTWQLAMQLKAQHVEVLPTQTEWLLEHLVPPVDSHAHIVVVTPVVGGAGASTVACALAAQYVQQGLNVCLVDTDLGAGGLDVVMGCEQEPGMRWSDLSQLQGAVAGNELFDSLIVSKGIHVLAPKRGQFHIEFAQISNVIETVATACDVVIIDTPRLAEPLTQQILELSHDALLVLPTTVQASSLLTALHTTLTGKRCGLVVRQVPGSGLTPLGVAQAIEMPLRASLPTDARIVEQVEQGLGLAHVTLGAFSRSINQLCTAIEINDDNRIAV